MQLQSIDTHQPIQPMLVIGREPRLEALRVAVAILDVVVVINVGSPQDGVTPITVEAVFHQGFGVTADDSQRGRTDSRQVNFGKAESCGRAAWNAANRPPDGPTACCGSYPM